MIKVLGYGSGNIQAILNIYKRLNIDCSVAVKPSDLEGARKLILPGVGAFDESLALLCESGMIEALNDLVLEKHVPILGVCVGMQMMACNSEEGSSEGLGWIQGSVKKLNTKNLESKPFLPHMGWNGIKSAVQHDLFNDVQQEEGFYFLHSYYFSCENPEDVLATTFYGDEFASAVFHQNVFGFQFHPEKSHSNGVALFRNFAELI